MIIANIIGYRTSTGTGRTAFALDRRTGENLPEAFALASAQDVDDAMHLATQAWREYRSTTGEQRAAFLRAIAEGMEKLGDALVHRAMAETAYPEARVLVERTRTINQLRMFADIITSDDWRMLHIDEALPGRSPVPRPELRRALMAMGPVVVFGASNFPLAYSTVGGDTASALAVGCPVIIKAHEAHLGTNALVAEVVMKAAQATGLPEGVFSSLNGDGLETGKALVLHPDTAAVGFTGSQAGGRALFDLGTSRPRPIPVFAEMGSVNPVFLLPARVRENREILGKMLAGSMTLSVGQFCTNPGILVALHSDATDALLADLVKALEEVDSSIMLTPGIARSFHQGVARVTTSGGVTRMTRDRQAGSEAAPVLARVDADTFLDRPELHHEIFGPYSLVVECDSAGKMMEVARQLEGQLTATIKAAPEDEALALGLRDILVEKAGRIIFNGVPTGVEVCEAMTHGGPYPATTDGRFTAVGRHALSRWVRPVSFQDWPLEWLPAFLR